MYANWTSHSGRVSTFAPQSRIRTGPLLAEIRRARGDDLAPAVVAARRADPVREARRLAVRARLESRRRDLVLRAAFVRARVRLLLLGDRHGGGESSDLGAGPARAPQAAGRSGRRTRG